MTPTAWVEDTGVEESGEKKKSALADEQKQNRKIKNLMKTKKKCKKKCNHI